MHIPRPILLLALLGVACSPDGRMTVGLDLPDGDVARGRAVLQDMKCYTCHRVRGHEELPAPVVEPPVRVVLGGAPGYARSDTELVNAILNPSHRISARYARGELTEGGRSRMQEYCDVMTVRELVDLVSFLQSLYEPATAAQAGPAPATRARSG
jgi:hypothetical protein